MKSKKTVCLLLVVMLTFSLSIAGCSQNDNTDTTKATTKATTQATTKATTKATTAGEKEIKILTSFYFSTTPSGNITGIQLDKVVGRALAEKSGFAVNTTFILGDKEQAFQLKLASGEWKEDFIWMGRDFSWIDSLVKADAIIPLDKYFDDPENYPNLAKIDKRVIANFTHSDGHIYGFPGTWYEDIESGKYGYWCTHGWYVNTEIMESLGFEEKDLATLEGVENYLRAVKDANLKNADGLPILPLTGGQDFSMNSTIATAFGVTVSGMGFHEYDGEIMHWRDVPQFKEAIKWVNKMWREGLIDIEMFSQKNEQLMEKMSGGRAALVADQAWRFWGLVVAGENVTTKTTKVLPFPKVPGVDELGKSVQYNPYGSSQFVVSAESKNADDVAKYADWLMTTGEYRGFELGLGPRGMLWDWDPEKGEPYVRITDKETLDAYTSSDHNKAWEIGIKGANFSGIANIYPFDLDGGYFMVFDGPNSIQWVIDMHLFNVQQGYTSAITDINQTKLPVGGKYNEYKPVLAEVDKQFLTQVAIAESDADFEAAWKEYHDQLELQGHWSEVKEEFLKAYNE